MTRVPYAGDEKTEHALDGGNVAAGVVRVGDTVRKLPVWRRALR